MGQMTRDEVIETLRAHRETLAERFGVRSLALFGSYARGTATDSSDIDILADFDAAGSLTMPSTTSGWPRESRPTSSRS